MVSKSNKVILTCEKCLSRNYSTFKNKGVQGTRLELKKFCKKCQEHTVHKETR